MMFRFLLLPVWVLVFCFALPAHSKSTKPRILKAQIELLNGKKVSLSAPVYLSGKFVTPDFTITRLNIHSIASFAAAGRGKLLMKRRENDDRFEVKPNKSAFIAGEGEWGKERVPFRNISSLVLQHAPGTKSKTFKSSWVATFANGFTFPISGLSNRGYRRELSGRIADGKLGLKTAFVKRLNFKDAVIGKKFKRMADVIDATGTVVLSEWWPNGDFLATKTSFGSIKARWAVIKSLDNLKPKAAIESAANYELVTKRGSKLIFPKQSNSSLYGKLNGLPFTLKLGRITGITRSQKAANSFTVAFADGRNFDGFVPKNTISYKSSVGTFTPKWGQVSALHVLASRVKKFPVFQPSWHVVTKSGMRLPTISLRAGHNSKINGELKVVSLKWKHVERVSATPKHLALHLADGTQLSFEGRILANSPYGELTLASNLVSALVRDEAALVGRPPAIMHKIKRGTLTTISGTQYAAKIIGLKGGRRLINDSRLWGHKFMKVQSGNVEFWVNRNRVLKQGLKIANKRVEMTHEMLPVPFALSGVKGIEFSNDTGKFFAPIKFLKSFDPSSTKSQVKPAGTPRYRLSVIMKGKEKQTFNVTALSFARYPSRAWTGRYTRSRYPFQWHKSGRLFFKRKDNDSRVDIEFKKISSIQIPGRYGKKRQAVLTGRTGNILEGTIHPGNTKRRGSGVSRWQPSNEGVLGTISKDLYVFIRFNKASQINIEHL